MNTGVFKGQEIWSSLVFTCAHTCEMLYEKDNGYMKLHLPSSSDIVSCLLPLKRTQQKDNWFVSVSKKSHTSRILKCLHLKCIIFQLALQVLSFLIILNYEASLRAHWFHFKSFAPSWTPLCCFVICQLHCELCFILAQLAHVPKGMSKGWHFETAKVGLRERRNFRNDQTWKLSNTVLFLLADLYLYHPIILVSMCEETSWLAQFNKLHSRHIGCGSDACKLLTINEFNHCHPRTMFAQTEAVCQPQPGHLVQN